jgi:hypothetical protein
MIKSIVYKSGLSVTDHALIHDATKICPSPCTVKGNIVVDIAKLQPQEVWEHFQTLCEIPRPSKHEQAIARDYLKGWAELRGLTVLWMLPVT